MDFATSSVQKDGGVWATVTLRDQTTKVKRCVPKGVYADADRVECVTECSADMTEDDLPDKDLIMTLEEERFGDEPELEEKESRD